MTSSLGATGSLRRLLVGAIAILLLILECMNAAFAGGDGHWEAYPEGITASYSQTAEYVGVGNQVTFSVGSMTDEDSWYVNSHILYKQPDTPLTATWTITYPAPSGTTETHSGSSWTWTAPENTVGTFNVQVSVDDPVGDRGGRNDPPWTGGGTIVVCRIGGLTSDGTLEHNKTDHYINLVASSGNCVVTAAIEPSTVQESMLPTGFVTWTGGTAATPANQLTRLVPLSATANPTIKAKVGTVDEMAVLVHVVDGGSAFVGPPALTNTRAGDVAPPANCFGFYESDGGPIVSFLVYMPVSTNTWRFSTTDITHFYRTGVAALGRHDLLDPVGDGWLSANWATASTDLVPVWATDCLGYQSLIPARTITWCSDITWAHESFHADDFHSRYWSDVMISEVIPAFDEASVFFNCADAITTQAAARQAAWQALHNLAVVGQNAACDSWIADNQVEHRAYDHDVDNYNIRVMLIIVSWP